MISYIATVLLGWKKFILVATALCLVAALLTASRLTTIYQSTARINIELPPAVSGSDDPRFIEAYLASQMQLLSDDSVGNRMIDMGNIANSKDAIAAYQEAVPDHSIDYRIWLGRQLLNGSRVGVNAENSSIEIAYFGNTAAMARAMAELLRTAYIDETLSRNQSANQRQTDWLDNQTKAIAEDLKLAQDKKKDFERANNLIITRDGVSLDEIRLASRAIALPLPPQSQSSTVALAPSEAELSAVTAKIAASRDALGPNHPTMITMREQQQALQAAVASERAAIRRQQPQITASGPSAEVTIARGIPNAEAVATAKRLMDDIKVLEEQYTQFATKAAVTKSDASNPFAGVEPVGEASLPISPFYPNWPVIAALALIFGLLISSLIALLIECLNLRVWGEQELVSAGVTILNAKNGQDSRSVAMA